MPMDTIVSNPAVTNHVRRAKVPVSRHAIDSINLRDESIGLDPQIGELLRTHGVKNGRLDDASQQAEQLDAPVGRILSAGLRRRAFTLGDIEGAMEDQEDALEQLERAQEQLAQDIAAAEREQREQTLQKLARKLYALLAEQEAIGPTTVQYLNRLSDALFVMARYENRQRGVSDVYWDTEI